jgi:uncharacterized YigZ family protein
MDYNTTSMPSRIEYVEKRSKFIASSAPVNGEDEAVDFIAHIKTEFYDARHNVFAYIIKDGAERFSDDGEPQGSAGMPTLEVLRRRGIVNAVVVITRYFGGILLGAPGLLRAYSHAATLAIEASGLVVMRHCDIVRFSCGYDFYSRAELLVKSFDGKIVNRDFAVEIMFEVEFPKDKTSDFIKALTEISAGLISAVTDGETYLAQT